MTSATAMTIDLGDGLSRRLADRAAENGRSVEEEIRLMVQLGLVTKATMQSSEPSMAEQIRKFLAPIGGIELELPSRGKPCSDE